MNDKARQKAIERFHRAMQNPSPQPRRLHLADSENRNCMAPDWVAEGIKEMTGYEMSVRQLVALWNAHVATDWLEAGGPAQSEARALLRSELVAFLEAAGLKSPRFRLPARPPELVACFRHLYQTVMEWDAALVAGDAAKVSRAALIVGKSIENWWYLASIPGLERDAKTKLAYVHRGQTRRGATAEETARLAVILEDVCKDDPFRTGFTSLCRIVAHKAGKDPATGKPYRWKTIYRRLRTQQNLSQV